VNDINTKTRREYF